MDGIGIYLDFPSFAHFEIRFSLNVSLDKAATFAVCGFGALNNFKDDIETSVAGHSGAFSVERTFEVGIAEGLYFNYLDENEVKRITNLSLPPSSVDFIVYVNYKYSKRGKVVSLLPDRYLIRLSFATSSIRVFQLGGMGRTLPNDVIVLGASLIDFGAKANGFQGKVFNIEGLEVLYRNNTRG
jgi:hypothetical protein